MKIHFLLLFFSFVGHWYCSGLLLSCLVCNCYSSGILICDWKMCCGCKIRCLSGNRIPLKITRLSI
ncbi:hypothetical protein SLEP1_g34518 [Rubroshorea leprosula]|uniref:Secreted protein n=1 Tax=Rubroshorea leprosula TaxID=152421 RepID=A0AAV5KK65_9ROSI|nr:hypothetical protein SLEP1_g34518 [Rubroshorea leprosula]